MPDALDNPYPFLRLATRGGSALSPAGLRLRRREPLRGRGQRRRTLRTSPQPRASDSPVAKIPKHDRDMPGNTFRTTLGYAAWCRRPSPPWSIALFEDRIRGRQICNELLDQFVDAGRCRLHTDFAIPLPVRLIAEMLGVEPEPMGDFKRWSDTVVDALVADPTTMDKEVYIPTLREMNRVSIPNHRRGPQGRPPRRLDHRIGTVQAWEERDALPMSISSFFVPCCFSSWPGTRRPPTSSATALGNLVRRGPAASPRRPKSLAKRGGGNIALRRAHPGDIPHYHS